MLTRRRARVKREEARRCQCPLNRVPSHSSPGRSSFGFFTSLPLTTASYATAPDMGAVRGEVAARMQSDPIGVLDDVLVLLELFECNQDDIAEYFLKDMPFVRECFSSKRTNGWIALMGDGDRTRVESAINGRWKFRFFSGPPRPTGLYVLLSMLARYAFVYGKIRSGDAHELGHFVEEFSPGLIVCHGELSDLELTLSLAAMKMGVPGVVSQDYPFPLGRTIRTGSIEEITEAVVGFGNIRRLIATPEIPQLPDYCDPQNAEEEVVPASTWGGTEESFFIVRKGRVESSGFSVTGKPAGAVGVIVTIDAEPMDSFDRAYIERTIVSKLSMMHGVAARVTDEEFRIDLAKDADLEPSKIAEVLIAAVGNGFPKLKDSVSVEVIFDREKLCELSPTVHREKRTDREEIASATEETIDSFVGCTGCSPFAPDHACVVTPERPAMCGRKIETLKTGALYGYDDMSNIHHSKLQRGVNSFAIVEKGRCLDPLRGEWSGANEHVSNMTQGRTRRVFLHCLDEVPHTACGCFRLILFKTDAPREGIGIMDRRYEGTCSDGRCWKDLYYQLTGKQSPGLTGAVHGYLLSPKFLQGHRGWESVVWVSPQVAEFMGEKLPPGVNVGC